MNTPARKRAPGRRGDAPDFGRLRERLREGAPVLDAHFDRIFPSEVRKASCVHWTPIEVAARVARLVGRPGARILDIGSGVGKFCIVAAACADARVTGIEQRDHLVQIARSAAVRFGVDVDFRTGTIEAQDPLAYDAVYLFNPFAENLAPPRDHLDATVELSESRFWRDVEVTERFLAAARIGTRVVTYCGFGGEMPAGYVLERRERCAGLVEVWAKGPILRSDVSRGDSRPTSDPSGAPSRPGAGSRAAV